MNEVTAFMHYMFNRWCLNECRNLFGKELGDDIWRVWHGVVREGGGDQLRFYANLDNECRKVIVERATRFYGASAKKVWVLTTNQAWDGELCINTHIYSTKEKAQEALDSFAHDEYQYAKREGWVIDCETDTKEADGSYTEGWIAYGDGDYPRFHSEANIYESEIL